LNNFSTQNYYIFPSTACNVISHKNGPLTIFFLLVYYAGYPPFIWWLWFNYMSKYHCEKYENILTSGFEHYHFPLKRKKVANLL
jgi:hypothetical protein